jgi:uridine kinase
VDFEAPEMMDLDLLGDHFSRLTRGEPILVPHFEFARQMRNDDKGKMLRLGKDEVAIFEGIHALNTKLTADHPEATRLYVSARSNVMDGEDLIFKGTWMRLTRRAVRDYNFRGTDVQGTLDMWANVRRGEKLYISPYKENAHIKFDSSLAFEFAVLKPMVLPLLEAIPAGKYDVVDDMLRGFEKIEALDQRYVAPDSLAREFIGGSTYDNH